MGETLIPPGDETIVQSADMTPESELVALAQGLEAHHMSDRASRSGMPYLDSEMVDKWKALGTSGNEALARAGFQVVSPTNGVFQLMSIAKRK